MRDKFRIVILRAGESVLPTTNWHPASMKCTAKHLLKCMKVRSSSNGFKPLWLQDWKGILLLTSGNQFFGVASSQFVINSYQLCSFNYLREFIQTQLGSQVKMSEVEILCQILIGGRGWAVLKAWLPLQYISQHCLQLKNQHDDLRSSDNSTSYPSNRQCLAAGKIRIWSLSAHCVKCLKTSAEFKP